MKGILSSVRKRGIFAWLLALVLISFYVVLYWGPDIDRIIQKNRASLVIIDAKQQQLAVESATNPWNFKGPDYVHPDLKPEYVQAVKSMRGGFVTQHLVNGATNLLNPLSELMRGEGRKADRWFLYGFLYTFFVIVMGIRFFFRWKKSRYQIWRTASVIFFQTIVAFIIPAVLVYANTKEFYFHYFWPLKMEYFYPQDLKSLPTVMAVWAVIMAFVAVPVLTYFFGKRWYCSWVCGCGALAETAGDPFRHLSDKSSTAWRVEQITVHSVLVLAVIATALLFINEFRGVKDGFAEFAFGVKKWYAFFIASGFAGVVGT